VLGRDVTHEIASSDWTPDATRWLGIDRRAFLAMASVRQSELRALREHAGTLREFVQRAVATAGSDSTAAAAIERIDAFLREHVGARTAHSVKPLRRAQQQYETAQVAWDRARVDHDAFLHLLAREEEHVTRVARAAHDLRLSQAARALSIVAARREVVERVRALQHRHPDGPPPERAAEDGLARAVDRALQAWAGRPAPVALAGPSAAELRRELEAVQAAANAGRPSAGAAAASAAAAAPWPPRAQQTAGGAPGAPAALAATAPAAGVQPAAPAASPAPGADESLPQVRAAAARFEAARAAVRSHATLRPQVGVAPPGGNVTLTELQMLAERLAEPEPVPEVGLETRLHGLEIDTDAVRRATRLARIAGFALLAVAIVGAAIVAGSGRLGWLAVPGVLAAVAVLEFVTGARRAGAARRLEDDLQAVRDERHKGRARRDLWETMCEEARERAHELGLPPDAAVLLRLAQQRAHWDENRHRLAAWQTAHTQLERDFERFEDDLRVLLRDQGVAIGPDLAADVAAYEITCRARAHQHDLAARLERRSHEEAAMRDAHAKRASAAAAVLDAARRCGILASDAEAAIAPLHAWLESRGRSLAAGDRAQHEWAQLETLRNGRSLADLESDLASAESRAAQLASGLDTRGLGDAPRSEEEIARRQHALTEAELQLARLRAELERHPAHATPLADAEDDLRAAEHEVRRVEALEETLRTAQRFLVQAQERVHRDVAPLLANAVRTALPAVTAGRWVDARVDPESLDVSVQDAEGHWRRAALLSHGTAEQVYLLLRAGLVRHLVRRRESCPLFLDDATVQFDRDRKRAALAALHALSRERQVIVFTQEDAVLEWAREHTTPSTDAVITLASH
jgi:hypothetical protein